MMEERLSRDEIVKRLALEYQRLMDTFARLTPEQWIAAGAVGTWTAKDVMAHLVFWNRFPVQELQAAVTAAPLPIRKELATRLTRGRSLLSMVGQRRQFAVPSSILMVNC